MIANQIPGNSDGAALPFWRRLHWSLIISFVCLAVLPVGIIEAITLPQSKAQAQQQIFNQLTSVAELKQNQIATWLDGSHNVLDFLLSSPLHGMLVAIATDPPPSTDEQNSLNNILKHQIAGQDGAADVGVRFRALFVYTADGRVVAASDDVMIGRIVSRQPYFAASLKGEYIQPPHYAVGTSNLAMFVTRPVINQQGQTVGVLAGELDLATLGKIMLARSGLGESGETYLVSAENNYLLTPSRFEGYPLTRAYHSEGIDRALSGKDGSGVYDDYRTPPVPVFGVYRWIPGLQAALLTEINESEALSTFQRTGNLSIALAAGAILVAVAFGLYTATRVSRPITALTHMAARIAGGDLSQRAQIAQRNEIGLLAFVFNTMTSQLQETQEGLERRVAERTAELERAFADLERTLAELRESASAREQLSATVREMSSPVVPVLEGILVTPLIGVIDSDRAELLVRSLLEAIEQHHAGVVIMDVTGVPIVDTQTARVLLDAANAARMLGAQTILVGLRPELAQTIVGLGLDLSGLTTRADLQSGVSYAMEQRRNRRLVPSRSASPL
jgi:anti-anti-sigma factor